MLSLIKRLSGVWAFSHSGIQVYDTLLFLIIAGVLYFLERNRGKAHEIDYKFSAVLIPYITVVSISSASFASSFMPDTFFAVSIVSLSGLVLTMISVDPKRKAYVIELFIGLGALILAIILYNGVFRPYLFLEILVLGFIPSLVLLGLLYLYFRDLRPLFFFLPIFTQFLDASSTVIAVQRGLTESRFLAGFFLSLFGYAGVFVLKSLIFLPIAYVIYREEDIAYRGYIVSLLFIYGLFLFLRNYFLIVSS